MSDPADFTEFAENVASRWTAWANEIVPAMRTVVNAFNRFACELERRNIAAQSIQTRLGIHRDTANWLAWRLPESALPSKDAVETLLALERTN